MRRIIPRGLFVVAVLGIGWTVGWFYCANLVKTSVADLADSDGYSVPRLVCGSLEVSGYPLNFNVACRQGNLTVQDVTYTLAAAQMRYTVLRPFEAQASADGPVDIADAFTGSRQQLDWSELDASIKLDGMRIDHIGLVASDVSLASTVLGEETMLSAQGASLDLLDIPERHDPETRRAALAGYLTLDGVAAPGVPIEDGAISIEAEVDGIPDNVSRFTDPDLLLQLQANQASLKLVSIDGRDAMGQFTASGDFTLDQGGKPNGQLKVSSTGVVPRIEFLVPPEWRLLVLGAPAEDGSYKQNLSLRGGTIFSGLIPIGSL